MSEKIRTMSLYQRNMQLMLAGTKTVEIRVRYLNYKTMTAGQLLKFLSGADDVL